MPNYSMKNTETNEIIEIHLKMADREQYLADNPHMIQVLTHAIGTVDSVRIGKRKPDMGFREVLQKAQVHRGNKINTF